jgi:molybdate-binding protein
MIQEFCTKIRALKRLLFLVYNFLVQNKPMIYGYAWISTDGQSVAARVAAGAAIRAQAGCGPG